MHSDEFRIRWASHDVRLYAAGVQRFHRPLVGDLTLSYEALELTADVGVAIVAYSAEALSASQDALAALAGRGATAPRATRD